MINIDIKRLFMRLFMFHYGTKMAVYVSKPCFKTHFQKPRIDLKLIFFLVFPYFGPYLPSQRKTEKRLKDHLSLYSILRLLCKTTQRNLGFCALLILLETLKKCLNNALESSRFGRKYLFHK